MSFIIARKDKGRVVNDSFLTSQRAALGEWIARDNIRKSIKGLGRNDLCPSHGLKIKKCGCVQVAEQRVLFNSKHY
jgi:hypothetical protein